ncbi:uncharacterized protein [Drosophila tropicalis]|uniref:uncharacterized protein n=1 Tax=Drosophila tropicalis TaxID=46794 RepID=UPI0035ABB863
MPIRKLLLLITVLLTFILLVERASSHVKESFSNTTDSNLYNISRNSNATSLRRSWNGKLSKIFPIEIKKSVVKRSSFGRADPRLKRKLQVRVCPRTMIPLKNISKERLLGVWYAYATTPLDILQYQRRCTSYNVMNNPYFNTNILYTDYIHLCITYSCLLNKNTGLHDIKLRILTRTRIPMAKTLRTISEFLLKIKFPITDLDWLKTEAFCFEWYQLNFELYPRPGRFQAPWGVETIYN